MPGEQWISKIQCCLYGVTVSLVHLHSTVKSVDLARATSPLISSAITRWGQVCVKFICGQSTFPDSLNKPHDCSFESVYFMLSIQRV